MRQRATRMCLASWWASGRRCRPHAEPARFRSTVQHEPAVCDLHRPDRREQRAAASCSRISSATRRRFRAGWIWCWSAARSCRCRRTPASATSGFLSDEDKFDALAAADVLIMPSYFESLSMVALEAWALGRPVLANGRCDVLKGQCIRSSAGLYYESYEEFAETLYALESKGPLHARLGQNGRDYFTRHYAWPVIERKYLDMLGRLSRGRSASTRDRAAARVVGAPPEESRRRLRSCCAPFLPAPSMRARCHPRRELGTPDGNRMSDAQRRDATRAPGPGHSRLRRCDRPRGAGHSARAARRRLSRRRSSSKLPIRDSRI